VDFVSESDDFSAYPVLIAPAYQLIDEDLVRTWTRYVEGGGNLVLTCRTGQKKRNGQLWEAKWAQPIYSLVGAEIPFFDLLLDDKRGKVTLGTGQYEWNTWGDVLEPAAGTESLATYADQFYAGKTAVTYRKLGKGSVTYVGVHTTDGRLERNVLQEVLRRAGATTEDYPAGVFVTWRDGFWVAVNYSSAPVDVNVPDRATILLGSRTLKPADVLVWN
jgi:beta-galactosidase